MMRWMRRMMKEKVRIRRSWFCGRKRGREGFSGKRLTRR
jgi:hypothetical protein